jgi:hypothetical protein
MDCVDMDGCGRGVEGKIGVEIWVLRVDPDRV